MTDAQEVARAAYDPEAFRALGRQLVELVAAYLATDVEGPVTTTRAPGELAARFDEPLPVEGRPVAEVLRRLEEDYLADANRLVHPRYVGHQVAPPLPLSAAVDLVGSALNNGAAVWEMSPTGTVVEVQVLRWFAALLGWPMERVPGVRGAAARGAGGSFVDGGTLGNVTALAAARARAFPDAWRDGMAGCRGALVAASTAHYCVERAAGTLGFGSRGVASVPSADGTLDPSRAREAIRALRARDVVPVALVGCAGSTPTGSIDDLGALADVCAAEGVWFHVDAAHGGAFLLSPRLRPRLAGLERADSLALDLHKMMFQPISTAMVLVRDAVELERAFAHDAPYLFHERADEEAGEPAPPRWDLGERSFQCSRRVDALRAWCTLQHFGAAGIARLQEHCVDVAAAGVELVRRHPRFEPGPEPTTNILCFRHVPPGLGADPVALDAHQARLRERVNRGGDAFVTATMLAGRRYLRMTIINPRTEPEDVARVLARIDASA